MKKVLNSKIIKIIPWHGKSAVELLEPGKQAASKVIMMLKLSLRASEFHKTLGFLLQSLL